MNDKNQATTEERGCRQLQQVCHREKVERVYAWVFDMLADRLREGWRHRRDEKAKAS